MIVLSSSLLMFSSKSSTQEVSTKYNKFATDFTQQGMQHFEGRNSSPMHKTEISGMSKHFYITNTTTLEETRNVHETKQK